MADLSDLKVQLTLSLGEMKTLVALLNFAEDRLGGDVDETTSTLVEELSTMYFQMMEQLSDGNLGDFEPE